MNEAGNRVRNDNLVRVCPTGSGSLRDGFSVRFWRSTQAIFNMHKQTITRIKLANTVASIVAILAPV